MALHPLIRQVTDRIKARSAKSRDSYLRHIDISRDQRPRRGQLSCGNLAHGFAACSPNDKAALAGDIQANYAIVSAYNDMLSAHAPFESYPAILKEAAHQIGAVAQFAGGVPAMCDGVTQGQPGMELSLFSRDVIAMSTAIALSHNMFDGAFYLGVCDKIVPGLLIGALSFGHLPAVFIPAGPMMSGLPNAEKAHIRQLYAEGKLDRAALLAAESKSYHSQGTCTFYGTANSNQMLMEIMGLQLPGSSFVNPTQPLRDALTRAAVAQMTKAPPIADVITAEALVNGMIGLLATGGSTNHSIHLMAIGRAAGLISNWQDLADLSGIIPLLARIYPNGLADVNHFHAAGGLAYLIRELLAAGLLHHEVTTIMGSGLDAYTREPRQLEGSVQWQTGPTQSLDHNVLRPASTPFQSHGGLTLLTGNLGRAILKTSALKSPDEVITAPAMIFDSQQALDAAFKAGEMNKDVVAVVRFQGPKANGMPELHKLTPPLGVLQDKGFKVALVTDGRMSGASGKVPAAIHLSPEAYDHGPISRIRNGDIITLDPKAGTLMVDVPDAEWTQRRPATPVADHDDWSMGRNLFANARQNVTTAEEGASIISRIIGRTGS